jgi:hypothetical protein
MRWYSLIFLLVALIQPVRAEAAEYRLQVVSLYEEAFAYYLEAGDRAVSPLTRLESALDRQQIPKGTVLYDRWVQPAEASVARAFGATLVKSELVADRESFLPEFRWQGEPGTRTVWVVKAQSFHFHELWRLGLKGTGPLRHVIPYPAAVREQRLPAVGFPANLVDFLDGRPDLWTKWLSRYLDLADGIVAVVGVEPNSIYPDRVYLVIEQPAEPRTFKVVLGWRKRLGLEENLFQLGGDVGIQ